MRTPRSWAASWFLLGAVACGPEKGTPGETASTSDPATGSAESDSSTGEPTDGSTSSTTGCTTGETVECMDIAVTPGGPLGCGGEELVLDDDCDALAGYEVCADETVHRHTSVPCDTNEDIKACRGPDEGCSSDEDCAAGAACTCNLRSADDLSLEPWHLYTFNFCVRANCRTDADCGGARCGVSRGQCLEFEGFFCRTPADECASDLDCATYEDKRRCTYSLELERWACTAYDAFCE